MPKRRVKPTSRRRDRPPIRRQSAQRNRIRLIDAGVLRAPTMPFAWPDVLFSITEYFRRQVRRQANADGTTTEIVDYFDRRTGALVSTVTRTYAADGTILSGTDAIFDGPLPKRARFDLYENGKLKRSETLIFDGNGDIVGRIEERFEDGWRVRTEEYEGENGKLKRSVDYGYDGSGRLIRITERDGDGKPTKVTTTDYRMDGSYSVTVTDYSTSPATITRTEFNANGTPK